MKYWDSSALVPLLLEEQRSGPVRVLSEADKRIVTWWATPVECLSALARAKRIGTIGASDFGKARGRLELILAEIDFVMPSNSLRERAFRLLTIHSLRAGDSLQLASALQWVQDLPRGAGFVSLDERLRSAAAAEGFSVFP